jgi:hypothetical protein
MTITAAWVRTLRDCKELIVVSDSRLNGGKKMDCGQKVLALPRSDAFICFAGDTNWAYPLMHQVSGAISTFEKSASRAQDIVELKTHVLKVFEGLRTSVHDGSGNEEIPGAEFLFGGYSWIRKEFMIWKIHFHIPKKSSKPKTAQAEPKTRPINPKGEFIATPAKQWHGQPFVFAGDEEHADAARNRLQEMLRSRGKAPDQAIDSGKKFKFDWEPFEVIRDMLRDVNSDAYKYKNSSIGGAPQILKIYEHLSSRYLAVDWEIPRQATGISPYVCGRRVLGYENPTLWILDPDTLISRHPLYTSTAKINDEESDSYPQL